MNKKKAVIDPSEVVEIAMAIQYPQEEIVLLPSGGSDIEEMVKKGAIRIQLPDGSMVYVDSLRLEPFRSRIKEILGELPPEVYVDTGGGKLFPEFCFDRNGKLWGSPIDGEALVGMGLATGLVSYCIPVDYHSEMMGIPLLRVNLYNPHSESPEAGTEVTPEFYPNGVIVPLDKKARKSLEKIGATEGEEGLRLLIQALNIPTRMKRLYQVAQDLLMERTLGKTFSEISTITGTSKERIKEKLSEAILQEMLKVPDGDNLGGAGAVGIRESELKNLSPEEKIQAFKRKAVESILRQEPDINVDTLSGMTITPLDPDTLEALPSIEISREEIQRLIREVRNEVSPVKGSLREGAVNPSNPRSAMFTP